MEGSARNLSNKWYSSFESAEVGGKRKRIENVGGNTKSEVLTAPRVNKLLLEWRSNR